MVVLRLPLVLFLPLLGYGCDQGSLCLGLVFAGLLSYTDFPQSWFCLCWSVVVHRLPPVLDFLVLGLDFAQATSDLGIAFAGLW